MAWQRSFAAAHIASVCDGIMPQPVEKLDRVAWLHRSALLDWVHQLPLTERALETSEASEKAIGPKSGHPAINGGVQIWPRVLIFPMKRSVTIRTIAEHLGLSPASVSNVLSKRHDERRMSKKTVERVQRAAKELGYVPNLAGRQLRAHAPSVQQIDLAIITTYEAPLSLVSQTLKVLQKEVDRIASNSNRFNVAIEMFHAGKLRDVPALLDASRYNGVLISNTLPADDRFLAEVHLPFPSVVIGRHLRGYSCVFETAGHVGRNAASILIEAGARELTVLHGELLTQATSDRVEAFCAEAQAILDTKPFCLASPSLSAADGLETMRAFLRSGHRVDGLFATTDSLAAGAYRALKMQGLHVGKDVAVVGVGDSEFKEFFDPPLTTLAGRSHNLLERAVSLLLQLVKGEKIKPQEIGITPLPDLRESSCLQRL
jgi:LacI family transcriptional regulator